MSLSRHRRYRFRILWVSRIILKFQRDFGLPIDVDDVAELLHRAEDEKE
jgi:hypothetical protein